MFWLQIYLLYGLLVDIKIDSDVNKFTALDVDFRKFEDKYEEVKEFERNELSNIEIDENLEIIDAYL